MTALVTGTLLPKSSQAGKAELSETFSHRQWLCLCRLNLGTRSVSVTPLDRIRRALTRLGILGIVYANAVRTKASCTVTILPVSSSLSRGEECNKFGTREKIRDCEEHGVTDNRLTRQAWQSELFIGRSITYVCRWPNYSLWT